MNQDEITASCSAKTLASNNKESLLMNISTLEQSLKLRIVLASLDERISYQMADKLIKNLGYRGI